MCLLAFVAACAGQGVAAQDARPMTGAIRTGEGAATGIVPLADVPKSQAAIVGQRVATTEMTITYSRPIARGRALFGGIIKYDEAWNPGADQATAIAITRDIRLEGHPVAAGTYSIWMIPRAETWTVILSRAAEVYHTPYPGEAQDALRFDVRPRTGVHTEALTFDFPLVEGKDAELDFRWGTVVIPLRIIVQ